MQIKKLIVDNYRCLVDFSVRFTTVDGGSSTILIGENGTGKSTMLKVITQIIMSFDSDVVEKAIDYSYELEYQFAGQDFSISQHDHYYQLFTEPMNGYVGKMTAIRSQLLNDGRWIFPRRVVAYYSGYNDGLFPLFRRMERGYLRNCRKELQNYLLTISSPEENIRPEFPRRKYNYCTDDMTPVFLCALLAGTDSFEKRHLLKSCKFSTIENVDIEVDLRKIKEFFPANDIDTAQMPEELVLAIDFIDQHFVDVFSRGFQYSTGDKAFFSLTQLEDLGLDSISIYNFFEKLASLFLAKYKVYVKHGESRVSVDEMSEGQRQLIKVLGMLGVCKDEDCLVLLDEPDAHMNPKWKYELKATIDGSLDSAINTQALIATHDPLVINGVDKKFIRIFAYNSTSTGYRFFFTKVYEPTEETKGMGIDGLLQSQYYGLQTSYDQETSQKYLERQQLYIKLINKEISEVEKMRLRELTTELGSLPISYNTIDFLYDDFIKEFRNSEFYLKEYLSFDEIEQRGEKIKEIIRGLYEGRE